MIDWQDFLTGMLSGVVATVMGLTIIALKMRNKEK